MPSAAAERGLMNHCVWAESEGQKGAAQSTAFWESGLLLVYIS